MAEAADSVCPLTPEQAARYLLEECRMVLPGVQALFGFQMIAVFSERFAQALDGGRQLLHLAAIGLVVVAIALIMAPAALHRQIDPYAVSARFIRISGRLVLASMVPLALAIALDSYLVAWMVTASPFASIAIALAAFAGFVAAWFLLPAWVRRRPAALR
jgi:hypothetical protein